MDLSKILSISGKTGLYQVVSQLKNAVLVESLTDKHRFPAFSHEKISSLEEIAVFTASEDKPLKDILKMIFEKEQGKTAIDPKSDNKKLQAYFLEVVPDYDQERVYQSDIRKIISWYNLLVEHNLLDFSEKEEEVEKVTENEKEGDKVTEVDKEVEVTARDDSQPAPKKRAKASKKEKGTEPGEKPHHVKKKTKEE